MYFFYAPFTHFLRTFIFRSGTCPPPLHFAFYDFLPLPTCPFCLTHGGEPRQTYINRSLFMSTGAVPRVPGGKEEAPSSAPEPDRWISDLRTLPSMCLPLAADSSRSWTLGKTPLCTSHIRSLSSDRDSDVYTDSHTGGHWGASWLQLPWRRDAWRELKVLPEYHILLTCRDPNRRCGSEVLFQAPSDVTFTTCLRSFLYWL